VREEVLGLLQRLRGTRAMLVVTHEPELFSCMADRRWDLDQGRLVTCVTT
jgi:ABC-type lipoprotein export system ATPase subunit